MTLIAVITVLGNQAFFHLFPVGNFRQDSIGESMAQLVPKNESKSCVVHVSRLVHVEEGLHQKMAGYLWKIGWESSKV